MKTNQVVTLAAMAAFGISAGTAMYAYSAPVAYGVSEQAASVTSGAGILGMIVSAITGVMAVLKGGGGVGGLLDQGKQIIGDIRGGNASTITVDAAFVVIAGAILASKGDIEPQLLADLGSLRKKVVDVVKA